MPPAASPGCATSLPANVPSGYSIARAGVERATEIAAQRRAMFVDMGHRDEAALDRMTSAFGPWVAAKLVSGEYLAWFAIAEDGAVAGGVGLWLMDWLPHVVAPGPPRGNLVNVYTERAHRRRGIARALVETALDWSRQNSIGCVILHASAEGRGLYECLGFRPTNELRILL